MTEILVRYAHFLGIIVFASLLVAEHILVKGKLSDQDLKRVLIIDAAYGVSALFVLIAGLTLWLWVGKPAEFYNANPVFHAKFGIFILMAIISIYPTCFYLKNRKMTGGFLEVPKAVVNAIRLESLLLVLIPLLAVFMAKGYGLG
ncbi:MAG: DUF2214 family protein [Pseudomonadales bacterium]